MAKRLENPHANDLGQGGVELTVQEFEEFLSIFAKNGADGAAVDAIRQNGFFAPILRRGFEQLFKLYQMQDDIEILAVCRIGSLDAMKGFILFSQREGSWPKTSD